MSRQLHVTKWRRPLAIRFNKRPVTDGFENLAFAKDFKLEKLAVCETILVGETEFEIFEGRAILDVASMPLFGVTW